MVKSGFGSPLQLSLMYTNMYALVQLLMPMVSWAEGERKAGEGEGRKRGKKGEGEG